MYWDKHLPVTQPKALKSSTVILFSCQMERVGVDLNFSFNISKASFCRLLQRKRDSFFKKKFMQWCWFNAERPLVPLRNHEFCFHQIISTAFLNFWLLFRKIYHISKVSHESIEVRLGHFWGSFGWEFNVRTLSCTANKACPRIRLVM